VIPNAIGAILSLQAFQIPHFTKLNSWGRASFSNELFFTSPSKSIPVELTARQNLWKVKTITLEAVSIKPDISICSISVGDWFQIPLQTPKCADAQVPYIK
jgi:hypothetical protein